jgi:hypothetical protein
MQKRLLAVPNEHLVQIRICSCDVKLPRIAIEDDLIPVFSESI